MKIYHILSGIATAVFIAAGYGCASEGMAVPPEDTGARIMLTPKVVEMLPEVVAARSDEEPKTAAEKKINRLHLFFFDKDGNFLKENPDCEADFKAYTVIDMTSAELDGVEVPKDAFTGQQTLEGVSIFAVANPICDDPACNHSGCMFRVEGYSPDGDICHGDSGDPDAETTITCLDDLLAWYYRPAERQDITELPAGGMPMVAHYKAPAGDCALGHSGQISIDLRALMARVDVKVRLEAKQTSRDRLLPTLRVTEYGVRNMPLCVPFSAVETTDLPQTDMRAEKTVTVDDRELVDGQEATLFTYYTYENIKQRTRNPMEIYPEEVKNSGEDVRQRWKPLVAPDNASAIVMRGLYVDHQGMSYDARFSVYLGSDVIDNFEVRRNHCYKNNIVIGGLDYVSSTDNVFMFDARVNVTTFNAMHLSVVNERFLDAHWCVLPMDVYFLDKSDASSRCTVTILGDAADWVRLEHVSSEGMGESDFKPGWGCRDYFTDDMLQNVVTAPTAQVNRSRDRIYFYVDENASTRPRTAFVEVKYESDSESYTDTLELDQYGLLPFTYGGNTYYMETVEEYTEHYDPLDPFSATPWYQPEGLPYAAEGSTLAVYEIGTSSYIVGTLFPPRSEWKPFNTTTANGLQMVRYLFNYDTYNTRAIEGVEPIADRKIYSDRSPSSAVQYACAFNKRRADGSVENLYWFLPGISELEAMLTAYYNQFPSFAENFYWSSSAAKNPNNGWSISEERENMWRARATTIRNNQTVESGGQGGNSASSNNQDYSDSSDYPNGGRTLRTQKLRVRAIRTADGVVQ